ncbi:MAG: lycopene beta-cyclase CrtY [Sphingorhabdus sp.]
MASAAQENIKCDVAIVGGGLSGGLIALALAKSRPEMKVVLVEAQAKFGGNHYWSFFATDIAPDDRWLTAPLVTYGWSGYEVRFPGHERKLDTIYYTIESERLDEVLRAALPAESLLTGCEVKSISPRLVVLKGGQRINAGGVIDARGAADLHHLECGWQKFTGQLLQLSHPHDQAKPVIMDATVAQHDGYRFVHILPFGMDKLFIEDTYYSDTPDLDERIMKQRIAEYARERGWNVEGILREEQGVLPVVMDGDLDNYWASGSGRVAKAGARGGFFHGVTSYVLPDAVRCAVFISQLDDLDGDRLNVTMRRRADRHWKEQSLLRKLNRTMIRNGNPDERYKIFERLFALSPELIERFFAGVSSVADKARILSGKPPVSVGKAIRALRKKA